MKMLTFLIIALLVPSVHATDMIAPDYYPYPQINDQATQQFYTVVFDGEGEASVAAKFIIGTPETIPLKTISVEIPGNNLRIINAFHEAKSTSTQCIEYKSTCTAGDERVCTQYYPDGTCKIYETIRNPCFRQEQQCIRSHQVSGWSYAYHPIVYTTETLSKSTLLTFNLPVETSQSETTTILLSYKVQGYAQKSAGIWHADFETAKIVQDTDTVRVSVGVVSDLTIKGGQVSIDYQDNLFAQKMSSAMESAELSDFSRRMEYTPGYVKETSALDPWESFHVKAEYSSSAVLLYKTRILGILLVVMSVFALFIFGVRKINLPKHSRPIVAGTVSALIIYSLACSTYWLLNNLHRWVGYSNDVIVILMILVVILSIISLLFAPSIYYGLKNGVSAGMLTFAATMISLIIVGIILIVVMSINMGTVYF